MITSGNKVVGLTLQYEIVVNRQSYPVVRYIINNMEPNVLVFDAQGRTISSQPLMSMSDLLQRAQEDLRGNWKRYQSNFLQGIRQRGP